MPWVSPLESSREYWVPRLPRKMAPTLASFSERSLDSPLPHFTHTDSLENTASFSSIQPLPSWSYRASSPKPSPVRAPNSSEPSLISPSPFLSRARKPLPSFRADISSFTPSPSKSK